MKRREFFAVAMMATVLVAVHDAASQLLLAFIINLPDFARVLDSLLDIVHEDFRDGLFIACMDSDDPEILGILRRHFMKWVKEGDGFEDGTGELGWLHDFLGKFINHFPAEELLPLMEHYFRRCN